MLPFFWVDGLFNKKILSARQLWGKEDFSLQILKKKFLLLEKDLKGKLIHCRYPYRIYALLPKRLLSEHQTTIILEPMEISGQMLRKFLKIRIKFLVPVNFMASCGRPCMLRIPNVTSVGLALLGKVTKYLSSPFHLMFRKILRKIPKNPTRRRKTPSHSS